MVLTRTHNTQDPIYGARQDLDGCEALDAIDESDPRPRDLAADLMARLV